MKAFEEEAAVILKARHFDQQQAGKISLFDLHQIQTKLRDAHPA